jgi:hypothetical protein
MYVSFDDGANWKRFQLNLPIVPITDLAIKNDDLIVATQGRSFWVLDDLTPLHQLKPEVTGKPLHVFQPRSPYRLPGGRGDDDGGAPSRAVGQNPPGGAAIRFHLKEAPAKDAKSSLQILDANDTVVREYRSDADTPGARLDPKAGMNRVVWDLRHADAEGFPGLVLWGSLAGPRAVPGPYKARLKVGPLEEKVEFTVKADPRASASQSDYDEQLQFLLAVRDKLTETHRGIKAIRDVREQLTNLNKRVQDDAEVADAARAIDTKLTAVEEALHQTKAKSSQDVLNFPIRLNNKLASVAGAVGTGDNRPTYQAEEVRKELTQQTDEELAKLRRVLSEDLPKFNELLGRKKVPGVIIDGKPPGK